MIQRYLLQRLPADVAAATADGPRKGAYDDAQPLPQIDLHGD
ncbi:hypothetical protein [Arthrobacter bambusae]|jgi:hypothetical protein|nr:hypothetical protein [Arthrobacter bambusae]MDQ0211613.1 hypothetical protein [Arthrobacter bambusae]MDQ0236179.1 hypothetical protein [Arthrobacter bambusae]